MLVGIAPHTADVEPSTTEAVGKPAVQQRHKGQVGSAMPHVSHQPRRITSA